MFAGTLPSDVKKIDIFITTISVLSDESKSFLAESEGVVVSASDITTISEQINLLVLNTMTEVERVGYSGTGFAAVAAD
jgi:methyl-accepting chemotaxis protein